MAREEGGGELKGKREREEIARDPIVMGLPLSQLLVSGSATFFLLEAQHCSSGFPAGSLLDPILWSTHFPPLSGKG